MSDGQVNLVLGPETHHGADKKSGMRAMTRTNSGTGPFALILRAIKSGFSRYCDLRTARKTIPANDLKGLIAWLKANPIRQR
jgi:hypothetical protein